MENEEAELGLGPGSLSPFPLHPWVGNFHGGTFGVKGWSGIEGLRDVAGEEIEGGFWDGLFPTIAPTAKVARFSK